METSIDPKTGFVELPGDTISLTDLMDELIKQFQRKPVIFSKREWLRKNYEAAAQKYNDLAGKRIMMENISSVIASMNYRSKKGDTLK